MLSPYSPPYPFNPLVFDINYAIMKIRFQNLILSMSLNRQKELHPCNLCSATDFELLYPNSLRESEHSHTQRFRQSDANILAGQIVRCPHCGLVYENPRETTEELEEIYRQVEDHDYLREWAWKRATFRYNVATLESFADHGRILDIGCGHGFFLQELDSNRWRKVGLDLAESAIREAGKKGVEVHSTTLEEAHFPQNHFDVVTAFHLLEHVAKPKELLTETFRILKPGGFLYLELPDVGSVPARMFKRNWWYIMRFHTHYFSRTTLGRMLRSAGFRPLYWERPKKSWSIQYLAKKSSAYGFLWQIFFLPFTLPIFSKIFFTGRPLDLMGVISQKPYE